MACTQSSGLVRHVFRLLHRSIQDGHPVPWVLFENVRRSHAGRREPRSHAGRREDAAGSRGVLVLQFKLEECHPMCGAAGPGCRLMPFWTV